MKFFLRNTETWSAGNKSKLDKTEKVSFVIEPSDKRYNFHLGCILLGKKQASEKARSEKNIFANHKKAT